MELPSIHSPDAAFVAGLIVSLHCVGMCGPLACAFMPARRDRGDAQTTATIYHLSRLGAYGTLGAIAGGLGILPLSWFSASALRWLPWMLVLVFLALALRLDRFFPKPLGAIGWLFRLKTSLAGRSRPTAAAVLGLATPLLPCGPLYFLVTLALLTGSALRGLEFMLAFGLGTMPLLWLAQAQVYFFKRRLTPRRLDWLRVSLALTAAVVIAWRLRGTLGFHAPSSQDFACF
ncbi:MAG: sulfite exporter TauE/SafE family protein [Verrucomicrobiota bacterium]|nr:sulfite exporter TauE/SafE family protein [Verrucomicrobiota bacterium]